MFPTQKTPHKSKASHLRPKAQWPLPSDGLHHSLPPSPGKIEFISYYWVNFVSSKSQIVSNLASKTSREYLIKDKTPISNSPFGGFYKQTNKHVCRCLCFYVLKERTTKVVLWLKQGQGEAQAADPNTGDPTFSIFLICI